MGLLFRGLTPVSPNQLQRQSQQDEADQVLVTDITYIRTYEGRLNLAVVLDLHSRTLVGWSMRGNMKTTLVLDALTMAAGASVQGVR